MVMDIMMTMLLLIILMMLTILKPWTAGQMTQMSQSAVQSCSKHR